VYLWALEDRLPVGSSPVQLRPNND